MSCCDLSVFMADFNYYFPRFFDAQPTEQQLKIARGDWRAGNTGYEAAHNAKNRANDAAAKEREANALLERKRIAAEREAEWRRLDEEARERRAKAQEARRKERIAAGLDPDDPPVMQRLVKALHCWMA